MYPYAPGQMGEKGEEFMTFRGFPVCDHLKSNRGPAQWVWKLLSFENLSLCLKLVSRI